MCSMLCGLHRRKSSIIPSDTSRSMCGRLVYVLCILLVRKCICIGVLCTKLLRTKSCQEGNLKGSFCGLRQGSLRLVRSQECLRP